MQENTFREGLPMYHKYKGIQICVVLMLLTLVVMGCGGGGGGTTQKTNPIPIDKAVSVSIDSPISNPAIVDVSQTSSMQLKFKVDGPPNKQLTYVVTWDNGSVSPAEGTVTAGTTTTLNFTPPNTNGICNITISVSNGKDVATKAIQINVTGITPAPTPQPTIQSIDANPATLQPGGQRTVTVNVNNPGGQPLTYSWSARYGQISGSGNTITWTAPNNPGIYAIYLTVSDGTSTIKTGVPVTVTSGDGGLLGQYFKTARIRNVPILQTEIFRRVDPNINLTWYNVSPNPALMTNTGWGARWTGYIKCEVPGTYVFRVHVDDGARLRIMDDTNQWQDAIPDNAADWSDHVGGAWLPATTVPLTLTGGKWYPIELEFFQGADNAFITLYWSINGGTEQIVPQNCLMPPS